MKGSGPCELYCSTKVGWVDTLQKGNNLHLFVLPRQQGPKFQLGVFYQKGKDQAADSWIHA